MEQKRTEIITIRVNEMEKEQFKFLSNLYGFSISKLIKTLVNRELSERKLTAVEIRNLPKELRTQILAKMTSDSLPYYQKYKDELFVEEIFDGVE